MKVAETTAEARADVDLVRDLTGSIIARAAANGWTRQELAQKAQKKSASALYGWRNGSRKNPSLLDLQAFARAVGLNVVLADTDVDGSWSNDQQHQGASKLKPETQDVAGIMEAASDELRSAIKAKVVAFVTERASHPLGPGEEKGSAPARRK